MNTFPLSQTKITSGFFFKRQKVTSEHTLQAVRERFAETGRFAALKCKAGENKTHIFWDSDVAKWLEAAAYLLAQKKDGQIEKRYDEAVEDIVSNQLENGYFNSYFQVYEPESVFKDRNCHELYCAGHIFEAAVAASEYLHDDRLLEFSKKYVDHIYERFVEKKDTGFATPGHEEIELALCRLYEWTGNEKCKTLAKHFLDARGVVEEPPLSNALQQLHYCQSHLPIREQKTAEGHAVRALYLYTGMADMARLDNDESLKAACKTLYNDVVTKKMYITGGTGSSYAGERFASAYDLPNYSAYAETCASIALALFSNSMLRLTGEAKYGHTFERALYNGIMSGVSLDGESFFYTNPLEMRAKKNAYDQALKGWLRESAPIPERVKVFDCSCCPPNICRFFERLPEFIWYADEKTNSLTLSQYISSTLQSDLADVTLSSEIPYGGKLRLKIRSHGNKITLRIRIPEWCEQNFANEKDGYLIYEGVFADETIEVEFPLALKKVYPNPLIPELSGKIALSYGPFILCAEGVDHGFSIFSASVGEISDAEITPDPDSPYAIKIALPVSVRKADGLYAYEKPKETVERLHLIPYFAWNNRGASDMRVWFPEG